MSIASQSESDEELLRKISLGVEPAFKILFERYYSDLVKFAISHVRSPEEAEGIVQEVFLYIWDHRQKIELRSSLKAYLYAATRYRAIYFFRKKKRLPDFTEVDETSGNTNGDDAQLLMEYLEVESRIIKVVDDLPPKCKEIYLLSREEGLSHKAIAKQLGVSVKTVENQIRIALKRIREVLS